MATTKNREFKLDATRPFYAVVGAGDLAVELARTAATDVQARVAKIDFEPQALREQAATLLNARVEELQAEAKKAQARFESRLAELQSDAKGLPERIEKLVAEYRVELNKQLDELTKAYVDLAGRGQRYVSRVRKQEATQETKAAAKTTASRAKATRTTAKTATKKAAKKTSTPAKATGTAAKKTATSATKAASDAADKAGK